MGLIRDFTVSVSHGLPNLASQQCAVIREKFLLMLLCKPEAKKLGIRLHQAVVPRVCVNDHLPLGQDELGARTGRTLSLLPIPPHVHCPGKGGMADLLLQKGGPIVETGQCGVTAVKDMVISLRTVPLRSSIR